MTQEVHWQEPAAHEQLLLPVEPQELVREYKKKLAYRWCEQRRKAILAVLSAVAGHISKSCLIDEEECRTGF